MKASATSKNIKKRIERKMRKLGKCILKKIRIAALAAALSLLPLDSMLPCWK